MRISGQADFAQRLLKPDLPCPSGLKTWNGSDPAPRFAVYRNNVVVSLVDALAQTFPVTQALVGEAFFRAMAQVFVHAHAPTSRVLAHYGAGFDDFVAEFPPANSLPYLADVARLEMLRVRAFHAASPAALDIKALAPWLSDAQALDSLTLVLHPSLQLLQSRYAVYGLWAAHQSEPGQWEQALAQVDPNEPQTCLVFRDGRDVRVQCLGDGAARFLVGLQQGLPVAQVARGAERQDPGFDVTEPMAALLRHAQIVGISSFGDTAAD